VNARGKVNLCLLVGAPRTDGLHPLVSVFQPTTLADDVTLEPASPRELVELARAQAREDGAPRDLVVCPGVSGENLALTALTRFRQTTGWDGPPQRLTIAKRIPIAGGMAGGSADAAAALRLASLASGLPIPDDLPMRLGADVPALLNDARALVTGAGEHVEPLDDDLHALVVVPLDARLTAAEVYRAFDVLAHARSDEELHELARRLRDGEPPPPVNDLEPAARRLCPKIDPTLEALDEAGAEHPMVTGSGPTVFGRTTDPERVAALLHEAGYPQAVPA
jgi:4-diphosphocytidyl-2-C-methyl-D-erythritol kinase